MAASNSPKDAMKNGAAKRTLAYFVESIFIGFRNMILKREIITNGQYNDL